MRIGSGNLEQSRLELAEYKALFETKDKCIREANELWREVHSDEEDFHPDLRQLLEWLDGEIKSLREANELLVETCQEAARETLRLMRESEEGESIV